MDIAFRKLRISLEPLSKFFNQIAPVAVSQIEKITESMKAKREQNIGTSVKANKNITNFEDNADSAQPKNDRKEKVKKEPGKPRVPEKNDHIDALLNRRKKWK